MNTTIETVGFLTLFHVIGGIALGSAVRHWIRGRLGCNTLFSAIWGLIFGGVPALLGYGQLASHGAVLLPILGIALFLATVVITALIPDWFVESFNVPQVIPIAFGGLFLLIGIVAGVLLAMNSEPLFAIIFFGAFAGSGGFIFVSGLHALLKE